jgi:hypothetical protein
MHRAARRSLSSLAFAAAIALASSSAIAATYEVGASQQHKSPCELFTAVTLAPGDVVLVDPGTYTDACQVTQSGTAQSPLVMQGKPGPRPVFDATGLNLTGAGSVPRAVFQFNDASHWRVEHLELKNAAGTDGNGAAFRSTGSSDDIVISDMSIHDCQDGIMSDGPGVLTIQDNDIFHNGKNDGYTHNLYLGNDTVHLVGNYIHDSNGGQNVKMRVRYIDIRYNFIANAGNYEIDLVQAPPLTSQPNAHAVMIGNVVLRNPNAANHSQTIVFGTDNPNEAARNGNFYAINNTFVLTDSHNQLVHAIAPAQGSTIHFVNNIIHTTVSGPVVAADPTTDGIFDGTNNWVSTGVTPATAFTGTVTGAAPGFVSASDFHLVAGAPVVDKGAAKPTFVDGTGATQDGTPKYEYADLGTIGRLDDGTLDLGAFEYGTPEGGVDASPGDDGGGGGGDSGGGGDGGGASDGGGNGEAPSGQSSGCGCTTAGGETSIAATGVWIGIALAAFRRRRGR